MQKSIPSGYSRAVFFVGNEEIPCYTVSVHTAIFSSPLPDERNAGSIIPRKEPVPMAAKNDIYTTETEYTFPEFRKMCIAQTLNDRKMMLVMIGIEALFAVIAAVFVMIRARAFLLIALGLVVAYPMFMISRINTYIKDGFRSTTTMRNARSRITFREDHLESVSNIGRSKLAYADIDRILETGTHYYIFGKKEQSYIVKKENCSPELLERLQGIYRDCRKGAAA